MKPICILLVTGTDGAPVQVTADGTLCVNSMYVQPFTGTGVCYLGVAGLTVSTGVGVIAIIPASGSFTQPQSQNGLNQLHPSDYWVAGTATGDKILVSYYIA